MPASSPSTDPPTHRDKWRALSRPDRIRLLALLGILQVMDLSLRTIGLRRTQRWLGLNRPMAPQAHPPASTTMADAQRLAELAAIAGRRGPLNTTCLRQALAVQWWLRRRGLDSQLRLGARMVGESLDAHAWVELDGTPLAQDNLLHTAFERTTDVKTDGRLDRAP